MAVTLAECKEIFDDKIAPIFFPYKKQMIWRFDLTKFEDIFLNRAKIETYIKQDIMPPLPYKPFSKEDKDTYYQWVDKCNQIKKV